MHQRFEGLHFHPELAFIVDGAARIDVVVALGRLKRRAVPFIQRIGRLDIVVRIQSTVGLPRAREPVGINQRMSLGRDDLDIFHADAPQFVGHKIGGFLDVGLVFFESADAGNAEKIFEFV